MRWIVFVFVTDNVVCNAAIAWCQFVKLFKTRDGIGPTNQARMIQTRVKIRHGARRRIMTVPFIDMGIGIRGIQRGEGHAITKVIPAFRRNQVRRVHRHLETVVYGLVVGLDIGAIEPPNERIQAPPAKFPFALRRKFLRVVRDTLLRVHEVKVLLHGVPRLQRANHARHGGIVGVHGLQLFQCWSLVVHQRQ